jgi:hypothetical protein
VAIIRKQKSAYEIVVKKVTGDTEGAQGQMGGQHRMQLKGHSSKTWDDIQVILQRKFLNAVMNLHVTQKRRNFVIS